MTDDRLDQTYKLGRVLTAYGRPELAAELADRWTGPPGERDSLRELAELVNRELLRAAMVEAGLDPLEGEVENAHRLLTDESVSAGMRTQQRRELERSGVDVESLLEDFVTHQAVHTFLTESLGVEHGADGGPDQLERDRTALARLQSRTAAVTESTVERLRETGRLTIGSFDVFVDVSVYCRDCGTQLPVTDLLDQCGCDCEPET